MKFITKHIGAYAGNPATIIELTVLGECAEITETINAFMSDKVDEIFIMELRELANELEEHNNKIAERE